jgi:hypothetical protein
MKPILLFLSVLFATGELAFSRSFETRLYRELEKCMLPYGRYEITEKEIVSAYGPGWPIVKWNRYVRRIFYDGARNVWIQFEFNSDTAEHPLVYMVISKLPFRCKRVAPKRNIRLPESLLHYLGMNRTRLESTFGRKMWKRDPSVYVPKTTGPVLMPYGTQNAVVVTEFYLDHARVAALLISPP